MRWQERVDRFGSLETVFSEWPLAASWIESRLEPARRAPDDLQGIAGWLAQELAASGIRHELETEEGTDRVRCRISWQGEVDPLHWLELGLVVSLSRPVTLRLTWPLVAKLTSRVLASAIDLMPDAFHTANTAMYSAKLPTQLN